MANIFEGWVFPFGLILTVISLLFASLGLLLVGLSAQDIPLLSDFIDYCYLFGMVSTPIAFILCFCKVTFQVEKVPTDDCIKLIQDENHLFPKWGQYLRLFLTTWVYIPFVKKNYAIKSWFNILYTKYYTPAFRVFYFFVNMMWLFLLILTMKKIFSEAEQAILLATSLSVLFSTMVLFGIYKLTNLMPKHQPN